MNNSETARIKQKLHDILMEPNAAQLLDTTYWPMVEMYFPELARMRGVVQNQYHVHDVWYHTLQVVDTVPREYIRRMIALFHDVGKPDTQRIVNGRINFIQHEYVGRQITYNVLGRMGYPSYIMDPIAAGVYNHMRLKQAGKDGRAISDRALRKFKHTFPSEQEMNVMLDVIHADNMAHAPDHTLPHQIEGVRMRLATLDVPPQSPDQALPVTGRDLLHHFNTHPGPHVGVALKAIRFEMQFTPTLSVAEALDVARPFILK